MRFSPDGSKLAVQAVPAGAGNPELWLLPYPLGPAKKLGLTFGASWFPDSRHLAIIEVPSLNFHIFQLSLLNIAGGSRQVIYTSPDTLQGPSVSPDGKRIAYTVSSTDWNVVEISLASGEVHMRVGGGGISWQPDWAPSGTHYSYATNRYGSFVIVDISPKEGFSRRLAEGTPDAFVAQPRWAPDGARFVFVSFSLQRGQLMLSGAAGGSAVVVDPDADQSGSASWSPDGQWIAYQRTRAGIRQLTKIRPGSRAGAVILRDELPPATQSTEFNTVQWSPPGDWILYDDGKGLSMVSPDGKAARKLTARVFSVFGFSRDGSQVFGVFLNRSGNGALRQLFSIDVKSGIEKLVAPVDLPVTTQAMAGFSLNPDGKSFATSIGAWPDDIWMLEGFDRHKTLLERLLRR